MTKKAILIAVMIASSAMIRDSNSTEVEDNTRRIDALEFEVERPTAKQEVYDALDDFYTRFRSDFQEGVDGINNLGIELKYLRREVSVNTAERTENTRRIEENKGDIKSLGTAVSLNRALMLAIVGVIFGIVKKIYKKEPPSEEQGRIIKPGSGWPKK